MKKPKIEWWARCDLIARMGPFPSQVRASQALVTTKGEIAPGAFVWPEEVQAKKGKKA